MKHGSTALISEQRACVCFATQRDLLLKNLSNMQEIKARNAKVIVETSEEQQISHKYIDDGIVVPNPTFLEPLCLTITRGSRA
jgi:glucosamine 6-phosphate synthetase-like amidotransferase/phosphosugar isomerase protein